MVQIDINQVVMWKGSQEWECRDMLYGGGEYTWYMVGREWCSGPCLSQDLNTLCEGTTWISVGGRVWEGNCLMQMSQVKNVLDLLKEQASTISVMWERGRGTRPGRMVELMPPFPQECSSSDGWQLSPEGSKPMWASCCLAFLAEGMEIHVLDIQVPQWGHSSSH